MSDKVSEGRGDSERSYANKMQINTFCIPFCRSSLVLFDPHPETAVSVVVFQLCIALAAVSFASKSTISLPRGQILR